MEDMTLSAFMKENAIEIAPIEYVASKRFVTKDENGELKPVPWKLKPISNDRVDALQKKYTKRIPLKGSRETQKEFDTVGYMEELTVETVQYPNLNDAKLQASYGVIGNLALAKAMLTPGEFTDLMMACSEANGYESGMAEKIETVKNS